MADWGYSSEEGQAQEGETGELWKTKVVLLCRYILFFLFFLDFYLFIFRERGKEGEREGEKQQCVVASRVPPTGDLAHNPGMCLDWESNW